MGGGDWDCSYVTCEQQITVEWCTTSIIFFPPESASSNIFIYERLLVNLMKALWTDWFQLEFPVILSENRKSVQSA